MHTSVICVSCSIPYEPVAGDEQWCPACNETAGTYTGPLGLDELGYPGGFRRNSSEERTVLAIHSQAYAVAVGRLPRDV